MQRSDYAWFVPNYNYLYRQYGKSFLAIKNKRVFGVYKTLLEGIREASKIEPPGTFILQECSGNLDDHNVVLFLEH